MLADMSLTQQTQESQGSGGSQAVPGFPDKDIFDDPFAEDGWDDEVTTRLLTD